ncbi:MAG: type I DNA topoisomerase [Alphaproteobacteria bacterium]|nr:type I DNA topoisomerase [Alphaproteobacteria bacterium]
MPMSNKLLIVESPAKSKTIGKYLGNDFTVVASIGHVRDLVRSDGSVDPANDFALKWENIKDNRGNDKTKPLIAAAKKADEIYLATDPDREGEGISWHIAQIIGDKKPMHRVVFHEITKKAVNEAIKAPRGLDDNLISAYLARLSLDWLVGFTLSPVLWRKLPGSKSAGRVQSVALRLVCEREKEIETFVKREYWSIEAVFETVEGKIFAAKLFTFDGKKLDKFDIGSKAAAEQILAALGREFSISGIERKKQLRKPVAPFTTSTLQQEASRKLGFSAKQTMQTAQRLYENGHITYMRTDAVNLSSEAVGAIRDMIKGEYGDKYLPKAAIHYDNKSKNAQEAHEAIRPTHFDAPPAALKSELETDQLKLYELIFKRTVACQMVPAELNLVAVDIVDGKGSMFRANGSQIAFDGFMKVYKEDEDDKAGNADDDNKMLPAMTEGDAVKPNEIKPEQHFTQPPPRYSEASLVKKMEELGIGRPSTYASILSVIQDRGYAELDKKKFVALDRGRIVSSFLEKFFAKYVEYGFTAFMEEELDNISHGKIEYKKVLRDFWGDFSNATNAGLNLPNTDVIAAINRDLDVHFFPANADGSDPHKCPSCEDGRLDVRLGRYGAFIGCSRYPDCKYIRNLSEIPTIDEDGKAHTEQKSAGAQTLGSSPDGTPVYLKKGIYGEYVQLGDGAKDDPRGPVRTSLPKGVLADSLTLEQALFLLELPKSLGVDDDGGEITLHTGRYGPYVKKGDKIANIKTDIFTTTLADAHAVLLGAKEKPRGKTLGLHPSDNAPVVYHATGKYGPYVQHNRTFANMPEPENEITLDLALAKLAQRTKKK